jgi:WD40 repeat protein
MHGKIRIYNSSTLSLVNSFQGHSDRIFRIKQSPFVNYNNSNYVATASFDLTVKIWDSSSNWSLIRTYSQHSSDIYGLEWLDKDTLASCGIFDQSIKIWYLSSGQTKRIINVPNNAYIFSIELLKNQIHMAVGLGWPSNSILIYNINNGSLISTLQGHTDLVRDLLQINENDLLASSSDDKTIRIWNLTTNMTQFILQGHTDGVVGLKQINSKMLASSSLDGTVILWNITSASQIRTFTGHMGYLMWSIDINNNSKEGQATLVSGGYGDKTIRVWDLSTGACLISINTSLNIGGLAVLGNNNLQQEPAQTRKSYVYLS